MAQLSTSILIFNAVLCFIGLRIQLIDFHFEKTSVQHKFSRFIRKYHLKYIPIIFLIMYLYQYQSEVSELDNMNKKSVQFFISYAFYNGKYVTLLTIYIFQYLNQRKLLNHQTKIKQMFMELWSMNRYLRTKYGTNRKSEDIWFETLTRSSKDTYRMKEITVDMVNVFNYRNIAQMLTTLVIYLSTNQPR